MQALSIYTQHCPQYQYFSSSQVLGVVDFMYHMASLRHVHIILGGKLDLSCETHQTQNHLPQSVIPTTRSLDSTSATVFIAAMLT